MYMKRGTIFVLLLGLIRFAYIWMNLVGQFDREKFNMFFYFRLVWRKIMVDHNQFNYFLFYMFIDYYVLFFVLEIFVILCIFFFGYSLSKIILVKLLNITLMIFNKILTHFNSHDVDLHTWNSNLRINHSEFILLKQ